MKYWFLVEYDRITNLSAPGYIDKEISLFLTEAQKVYIENKYDFKKNRLLSGFEDSEKRRKELSELIRDSVDQNGSNLISKSTNQIGTHLNGVFFDLPDDVMYVISETGYITGSSLCIPSGYGVQAHKAGGYTTGGTTATIKMVDVQPVTHDEIASNRRNPFKKPDEWLLWRVDVESRNGEKRHEIIGSGAYTISDYRIRYIKVPFPIITAYIAPDTINGQVGPLNCELNPVTHNEIVRIAVSLALEAVADPRYQTNKVEQISNES